MNFKELRVKAGFSQESLAQKLGVAVKTVCRWEHGQSQPDLKHFFKLKEILGEDIEKIQRKGA